MFLLVLAGILVGCQDSVSRNQGARILAVGDSLLAWNSTLGSSIPDVIEKELGETVVDRSISGAWMQTREGKDARGANIRINMLKAPGIGWWSAVVAMTCCLVAAAGVVTR